MLQPGVRNLGSTEIEGFQTERADNPESLVGDASIGKSEMLEKRQILDVLKTGIRNLRAAEVKGLEHQVGTQVLKVRVGGWSVRCFHASEKTAAARLIEVRFGRCGGFALVMRQGDHCLVVSFRSSACASSAAFRPVAIFAFVWSFCQRPERNTTAIPTSTTPAEAQMGHLRRLAVATVRSEAASSAAVECLASGSFARAFRQIRSNSTGIVPSRALGRPRLVRQNGITQIERIVGDEGPLAGEQFIEDNPQAVDVGTAVDSDGATGHLFWRHVGQSSRCAGPTLESLLVADGNAEIGQVWLSLGIQQDVRRFDVAMDKTLLVSVMENLGNLCHQPGRFFPTESVSAKSAGPSCRRR